jgi:tRNA(fMet)-specific endonuclease VapC
MARQVYTRRMKYLLDSNILIAIALAANEAVGARARQCDEGDMVTSSIAYAEVVHGSVLGKPPPFDQLQLLIEEVLVLPFDEKAARFYASLPFERGSYDRLIAAHALSRDLIIVTHNEKHFADVPGLKVENWTV